MATPVLTLRSLSKSYGPNRVLRDVSLDVGAGEVAALLGENGAGKSTLLKILAGVVRTDGGTVEVDGQPVTLGSPRAAAASGIAYIPQELTYVPDMTVAENICLGRWPARWGATSPSATLRRARSIARRFGFEFPLEQNMNRLSRAEQTGSVTLPPPIPTNSADQPSQPLIISATDKQEQSSLASALTLQSTF